MIGLTGVHHIAVSVPDIEVARRFYIDLLGAQEVSATEWRPGNTFIDEIVGLSGCAGKQFLARLANTYVEVFEYVTPRSAPQDPDEPVSRFGYTHFALEVEDIQLVYDRMVAAGIRFHCPPKHLGDVEESGKRRTGFRSTYGRDFFGNVFELMEIREGSVMPGL